MSKDHRLQLAGSTYCERKTMFGAFAQELGRFS